MNLKRIRLFCRLVVLIVLVCGVGYAKNNGDEDGKDSLTEALQQRPKLSFEIAERLYHDIYRSYLQKDEPEKCLKKCEEFLSHVPFGNYDLFIDRRYWRQTLNIYLELLREHRPTKGWEDNIREETLAGFVFFEDIESRLASNDTDSKSDIQIIKMAKAVPNSYLLPFVVVKAVESRNLTADFYSSVLVVLEEEKAQVRNRCLLYQAEYVALTASLGDKTALRRALASLNLAGMTSKYKFEERLIQLKTAYTQSWIGGSSMLTSARETARNFLKQYPNDPETDAVQALIIKTYRLTGDIEGGLDAARDFLSRGYKGQALAAEVLELAKTQMNIGGTLSTIGTLNFVVENWPNSNAAVKALMRIGMIEESRSGIDKALETYLRVTEMIDGSELSRTESVRTASRAYSFIANYYLKNEDYEKSLQYWSKWEPLTRCGYCATGLEAMRQNQIAYCMKKSGKKAEAENLLREKVLVFGSPDPGLAAQYVDLAADSESSKERVEKLKHIRYFAEEARKTEPKMAQAAENLEIYTDLLMDLEKKDYVSLWRKMGNSLPVGSRAGHTHILPPEKWVPKKAADLFANSGEEGRDFVRQMFDRGGDYENMAMHILAKMGDESVLPRLEEKLETDDNYVNQYNYMQSLYSLGTPEAMKKLREISENSSGLRKRNADYWLSMKKIYNN